MLYYIYIVHPYKVWEAMVVDNITYSLLMHPGSRWVVWNIVRKIGGRTRILVQDNGCLLWMLMPRIGDVVIYRGDGIAASLESVVVSGGRVVLLFKGDVGEIFLHLTEKNKVKEKREYSIIHC